MKYVNPIPAVDAGKEFEMRVQFKYPHLCTVDEAKLHVARYILEQTPETLASWIQCLNVKALYPSDLTSAELAQLTGQAVIEGKP